MPRTAPAPTASRPLLEQLIAQLEQAAAGCQLTIRRPRPLDWEVSVFKDHRRLDQVIFDTGHGDTLADAIRDLLAP